jgi:membrane protease subunit HflK
MNPQDPNLPPPGGAPPPEEAASQALAEALRSSFFIVKIIMVGLVLVFLGSGFFTVGPQEQAIVLRLGKPVGRGSQALLNPGPHWAWPAPIDRVIKIPTTSLTNADSSVGYYLTPDERAKSAPEPPAPSSLNPATTSYALSADTNIVHVVASAKYHVTDPIAFHFDFVDAPAFITNALNNALLVAASEFTVDDILSSNRSAFSERVQQRVIELTDAQKLGVSVDLVAVEDCSPPLHLKTKFNEVIQAGVKRDNLLNQAQSYKTTNVLHAIGEATNRINLAQSARKRMVTMIEAETNAFLRLRGQYERNPELFKRIRQMAVLQNVYTNVEAKIMVPPNSRELRFQLNREPQAPTSTAPTQP